MKKWVSYVSLSLVPTLILAFILVGYLVAGHIKDERRARIQTAIVEKNKSEIKSDLPIGVDQKKILSFLDSRGIKHSETVKCSTLEPNCTYALAIQATMTIELDDTSWRFAIIRFYLDEAGTLQDKQEFGGSAAD